jgi:hAT family C-terminal dimerisation region
VPCSRHGQVHYGKILPLVGEYAAAVLLDPTKREAYAQKNWEDDYVCRALEFAQQIWADKYENLPVFDSEKDHSASGGQRTRRGNPRIPTVLDKMLEKVNVQRGSTDADDLSSFTKAGAINIHGQSPIEWWCRKEQRLAYPRLHRMAIDILVSIPPMSDEPERVFSGARRTISWDRHNLSSTNVEMIESLASWIKEGIAGYLDACVDSNLEELMAGMELRDDDENEQVPVL